MKTLTTHKVVVKGYRDAQSKNYEVREIIRKAGARNIKSINLTTLPSEYQTVNGVFQTTKGKQDMEMYARRTAQGGVRLENVSEGINSLIYLNKLVPDLYKLAGGTTNPDVTIVGITIRYFKDIDAHVEDIYRNSIMGDILKEEL